MLPLGFCAFILFGYVLVLLGANQAGLSASLSLDFEAFGLLGAALSAGIGAGVLIAGPLVDRWPRRPLFLFAICVCALALGSANAEMGFARTIGHVFAVGLGGGIYDTLLNTLAVERYRAFAARPLALLHSGATLGAVLAPAFIAWLPDWIASFHVGAAAFGLLALWVAATPQPAPEAAARKLAAPVDWRRVALPIAALCAVGFAYVGVEAALTLFAVPYAESGLGLGTESGQRSISAFWLGLLLGRLVLVVARDRPNALWLSAMGIGGAGLLLGSVWLELRQVEWVIGAIGLALGGVFPLMVHLAGQYVPSAPGVATSLVVGLGSLGGFAVPWLTGGIADRAGIATAIASLSIWCAAVGGAALLARRTFPRSASTPA